MKDEIDHNEEIEINHAELEDMYPQTVALIARGETNTGFLFTSKVQP